MGTLNKTIPSQALIPVLGSHWITWGHTGSFVRSSSRGRWRGRSRSNRGRWRSQRRGSRSKWRRRSRSNRGRWRSRRRSSRSNWRRRRRSSKSRWRKTRGGSRRTPISAPEDPRVTTISRVLVSEDWCQLIPDWIQGYMYTLGRQGLCVSNSPVSS